jgi:hypothetical protein
MSNDFTAEELLKWKIKPKRGIEHSGVRVPLPKLVSSYGGVNHYKDEVVTKLPGGGTKITAPLPGGGTYTETHKPKKNNQVGTDNTYSSSTPDGGKVTVRGEFPDINGHGNFTADIKKPDGSSEHVRQWKSGMSGSSHGVHTHRDATGNITNRFQIDNIRDWNKMSPDDQTFTHNNVRPYISPKPESGGVATSSSPATGGRYQVSTARQSRVATASGTPAPSSTGGEVGAKDDHPFHGNQFTAHGTAVAVKGPQPKAKSFTTDALLQGWGFFRQSGF